ncbi:hypothetical protein NPX13_g9348 [Xylaria arbuscula]|uniref:RanBD1 domain-containing protein n=1 Tax=Xylaria arbuscula TaxID=114810 RepID=A0A9W8TIJ3_9PEZI|nr:hypothetical protein NPX13_g9348 [Xylaria arbuscula]
MHTIGSSEHFKLNIPDPDSDLSGEAVAKAIPDDPSRTSSIYADQFLAHKCPSHFNELQRRQFFCTLDLRRLKYAADEIFTQKDWKLNILNFAKEYEKSRSMIMLRYGLYEFKSIKPSTDVLSKWRDAHGLGPVGEGAAASRVSPAKATKRKAEGELTPENNALMTSTTNQNKRRNLAQEAQDSSHAKLAPFKSKRKAEDSEGSAENKPNKQQKNSTPSTATSLFASILNKTQNGQATPSKQTPSQPSSLFSITKPKDAQDSKFATKANPFEPASRSLFSSPAKTNNIGTPSSSIFAPQNNKPTPSTNTGNIFSYLSESSPNSSDDEKEDDEDQESGSEPEPDSEEQGASAAVSTGTSTPPVQNGSLFSAKTKTDTTANIFGDLSKPADQPAKGGLFGRVQIGANGQPVRASLGSNEKEESPLNQVAKVGQQPTKTPAKKPGDFTFNPATTPISFGQPTPDTSKPTAQSVASTAESDASGSEKPASIFGTSSQPSTVFGLKATASLSDSPSTPQSSETPVSIFSTQKPTSSSTGLFGATPTGTAAKPSSETKAPAASASLFGAAPTSTGKRSFGDDDAPATTSIFGTTASAPAAKRVFGGDQSSSEDSGATKKQAVSIFDKPATNASEESKPFGSTVGAKAEATPSTTTSKGQTPSIFDQSFIAKSAKSAAQPQIETSSNLFNRDSNPLFGAKKDQKDDKNAKNEKAGKAETDSSSASSTKDKAPSIFDQAFIAKSVKSAAEPQINTSSNLFSRDSNPLFGAAKTNGATSNDRKSLFDQPKTQGSKDQTLDSGKLQEPNDSNKENVGSVLGAKALAPSAASSPSIFGTQGTTNSSTVFGAKTQESSKPESPSLFGAKATEEPKPAASSSLFGAKPAAEPSQPTSSMFSNSTTANNSIFSFGSQPASNPNTQASSVTFGAGSTPSLSASFGAPSSQPNANNVSFQFGSPAPSATAASFTFGQSSAPASGFSFSAGGDKQPFNNPFAASTQPSSQPSAPLFGGNNSTTVTPSSSFNFSFGQQQSSASQPAAPSSQGGSLFGNTAKPNGSTSFSFTQGSPAPKPAGLMNASNHLQASGDGSTRANSPFPAPSSIGTTPVNGTPEPQATQEDGEEAAHAQISLTEGGPGEEDETIVHEVRAKALVFVPVQKGDEEDKKKSPWSTRGVGPSVFSRTRRLGLNEYKSKAKTVNFIASTDDGSGLETWVLQVKTPELATKLASVLEANKSANKK